jgi:hypothetical protein
MKNVGTTRDLYLAELKFGEEIKKNRRRGASIV